MTRVIDLDDFTLKIYIVNYRQHIKVFTPLSEIDSMELLKKATVKHFEAGSVIEKDANKLSGVYFIIGGAVKQKNYNTVSNSSAMTLIGEGRKIGLEEQVNKGTGKKTITALTNVSAFYFTNEQFEKLFLRNEKFLKSVLKWLCEELEQKEQWILSFLKNEVSGRLATILTCDELKNKNVFLSKELNIEEMAMLCGTNKVYLNNTFKKLVSSKILDYNKTRLIVLNSTELKSLIKI